MSSRKLLAAIAFASAIWVSAPATAATITFSQSGYGQNGVLTGTFVGTSATGIFNRNSLTSYDVRFVDDSGRSLSGGYLENDFSYDTSTNRIQFNLSYSGSFTLAYYRNESGTFLDNAYLASSRVAPTITFTPDVVTPAVPEPATWAMMLVGLGLVGAASRYRRRSIKLSLI